MCGPIIGTRQAAAAAQEVSGGRNARRRLAAEADDRGSGRTGRARCETSAGSGSTAAKRDGHWVHGVGDALDGAAEVSGEKRTSGGAKGNTGPEAKDDWALELTRLLGASCWTPGKPAQL